jgi:uncharacterized protein
VCVCVCARPFPSSYFVPRFTMSLPVCLSSVHAHAVEQLATATAFVSQSWPSATIVLTTISDQLSSIESTHGVDVAGGTVLVTLFAIACVVLAILSWRRTVWPCLLTSIFLVSLAYAVRTMSCTGFLILCVICIVGGLMSGKTHSYKVAGSVVLVTGASSGLGRSVAKQAAREGARAVVIVARRREKLEELEAEIHSESSDCKVLVQQASISDMGDIEGVVKNVVEQFGEAPGIIVNNAGSGVWRSLAEDDIESTLNCTLCPFQGAMWLTQEFLPHMLKRGNGHVINVVSGASYSAFPGAVAYASARWAMRGFTENLRSDVEGAGIGVTLFNSMLITGTDYFEHNPNSKNKIPYLFSDRAPHGFMLKISADDAAKQLLKAVKCGRRHLHTPTIAHHLVLFASLFPQLTSWMASIGSKSSNKDKDKDE